MFGPERFLSDGQRSLIERLRLLILSPVVVERCEVVEAVRYIRVVPPENSIRLVTLLFSS
jgi:hypothetical protein